MLHKIHDKLPMKARIFVKYPFDTLNVSKTTVIIFSIFVPNLDNSIKLGSQCIETLNSCKFLGVHIDSKLSFKLILT